MRADGCEICYSRIQAISGVRAFSSKACPGLYPGWIPVRVKKTRQTEISTDWKFDEYDPEKPAQGRKSRYRLLGRPRHQRRSVVDEAKRRPRLCLYRQSRTARRGRLQRDSAQSARVRRRKS